MALVGIGLPGAATGQADGPEFASFGSGHPEPTSTDRDAEFGDEPLTAVLIAAAAQVPRDDCDLTANQLAALMLTPVWAETVSNSIGSAPSPMTLSRYDHGSETLFVAPGTTGDDLDVEGPVPFWHPGVGLWQMDSAGLGSLWSADQRIDVRIAAQVIAPSVATLWCLADFELVWADWFACQAFDCVATYEEIYDPLTDQLRNLGTTPIAATGGMQYRSCSWAGVARVCGWVDPALAQGNNAFTVEVFGPSPITTPFYVFRAGEIGAEVEVRIWLNQHSGRGDITAVRPMGSNARTALEVTPSALDFCDLTVLAGAGCGVGAEPTPTPTPVADARTCAGRSATIVAIAGQPVVGTEHADVIVGTARADTIDGRGGDDVICGGGGDDAIAGGAGDDQLFGGDGADRLWGQDGADVLDGGEGPDRLRGGDGGDRLDGGAGADDLNGGRDDDTVLAGDGDDTAVRGGTGDDLVDGGDGDDAIVSGNGGSDVVLGGAGDDALVSGGPRRDIVRGGEGNDLVKGLGGADELYGDSGDDDLRGGRQPDTLDGGAGRDACNGGTESDTATACEALVAIP